MKPKTIGIIGGAGPLAGAFLLERILTLSGKNYGCVRDADFPKVFLISFPFSDMLLEDRDIAKLQKELKHCLELLRKNGASILAIACNTLHAFLTDEFSDVVHLPRTLAENVSLTYEPLVFCTSASRQFRVHQQFLPCVYPDQQTQQAIDTVIDQILQGLDRFVILRELEKLIHAQTVKTVILGCTELSLFSAHISVPNKLIIDPLELVANKILQKSFLT